MSKSAVNDIVDDIKVLADYDIDDDDLDTLIIKAINFALKRLKQWFMDEGLFRYITGSTTLSTTANQAYIDISSTPADLDQPLKLTERQNDIPITIIPYSNFKDKYVDPSSDTSSTPEEAAILDNKLYLGPTPNQVLTLYLDYFILITKVAAGGTLPFDDKYDELIVAIGIEYLVKFLDRENAVAIASAKADVKEFYETLIVGASKNIGVSQGSASRRDEVPYFSPRIAQ